MILEAIFHGDLCIDNFPYPTDPDYRQAAAQVGATTAKLKEKLSPEDFALLEQLLNEAASLQYLESTACFRTGCAIGVELQREIEQELQFLDHN